MSGQKKYNRLKYVVFCLHCAVISLAAAVLHIQKLHWNTCCSQCPTKNYNITVKGTKSAITLVVKYYTGTLWSATSSTLVWTTTKASSSTTSATTRSLRSKDKGDCNMPDNSKCACKLFVLDSRNIETNVGGTYEFFTLRYLKRKNEAGVAKMIFYPMYRRLSGTFLWTWRLTTESNET